MRILRLPRLAWMVVGAGAAYLLDPDNGSRRRSRLARFATGRDVIVMFEGHYHGHDEEWLFEREKGEVRAEYHGVDRARQSNLRLIPFNDPDALGEALEPGDVACVVTEPVLTNLDVIQPELGFHDQLRRRTREAGTLLINETHTAICSPGGLTAAWSLEPDLVTLGKFIDGGVPIGVYGMSAELSDVFESPDPHEPYRDIASGGTLFANVSGSTPLVGSLESAYLSLILKMREASSASSESF